METLIGGILLIAIAAILTATSCILHEGDNNLKWFIVLSFLLPMLGMLLISEYRLDELYRNKPQAIEVYQGKTTLEITYRDSIPIDSTVVYKKK